MEITFTPLNEAFNIQHVNTQSYSQPTRFSSQCIFCSNQDTSALMPKQDNGSFRRCNNLSCRKQFRANILSKPIDNYVNATNHLQGSN
jgi:transcription elongation factor Elf1